jgi:hypothetical protein
MKKLLLISASALVCVNTYTQDIENQPDTLRKDALNVFMEASDHMRREIQYINYVRDIKDADVYIISTSQMTGSGGREYTYFLVGQKEFAGMRDTLTFTTTPDETTEGRREKEISTLKMGFMRYVARTPLSKYIDIRFTQPLSETVSVDRWNNWVFRPSLSAFLMGEKTFKTRYISGSISADRITEAWKLRFRLNYNYRVESFDLGDEVITTNYYNQYAATQVVKSLTDHWSYGGSVSVRSSTYSNKDFEIRMMPGIEYNLFPYSESTRRQLRLSYSIGYSYVNYTDTTIYNNMEENLWEHDLSIAYRVIQKWGSIDVDLGYSNYLHDWSKNNLNFGGEISLRIAKGLSLNLYGSYSIIHDQLSLVKGGVSTEEILLQIKELETSYSYYCSFGFSYTFGSIYNNVVNPRFGSYF